MKQPLTDERINRLIARRERLTNRRDEHLNIPAINEIDATLRDVPPGQRADVDKLLGRYCAVVDALERAAAEVGVKAEWLTPQQVAQLEAIDQGRRDWNDIKGDCDN